MILFDSMVLIYALRDPDPKENKDLLYRIESSLEAMEKSDIINISAITYVEVGRGVTGQASERFASLYPRFNILQIDALVAHRALEIMENRRKRETICRRCLGAKDSAICPECQNRRAAPQSLNDIFIVATADVNSDIKALYTYDSGIKELAD